MPRALATVRPPGASKPQRHIRHISLLNIEMLLNISTNVSCSMSPNLNVTNYKLLQTFRVVRVQIEMLLTTSYYKRFV